MNGQPIDIDFGGVTKTLNRVKDDGYSAEYFASEATQDFTLKIAHTIPSNGSIGGEQHMSRLTVNTYDSDGAIVRTASAWAVLKTHNTRQDGDLLEDLYGALEGFLTSNVSAVLARQS